jgi:hypothetical protein
VIQWLSRFSGSWIIWVTTLDTAPPGPGGLGVGPVNREPSSPPPLRRMTPVPAGYALRLSLILRHRSTRDALNHWFPDPWCIEPWCDNVTTNAAQCTNHWFNESDVTDWPFRVNMVLDYFSKKICAWSCRIPKSHLSQLTHWTRDSLTHWIINQWPNAPSHNAWRDALNMWYYVTMLDAMHWICNTM